MIEFKEFLNVFENCRSCHELFWDIFSDSSCRSKLINKFENNWDDYNSRIKAMDLIFNNHCKQKTGTNLQCLKDILMDINSFIIVRDNISSLLKTYGIDNSDLQKFTYMLIGKVKKDLIEEDPFIITLNLMQSHFSSEVSRSTLLLLLISYSLFDQKYYTLYDLYNITNPKYSIIYDGIVSLSDFYGNREYYHKSNSSARKMKSDNAISRNRISEGRTFQDFLKYHIDNQAKELIVLMQSGRGDRDQLNLFRRYLDSKMPLTIIVNSEQAAYPIRHFMDERSFSPEINVCIERLKEFKREFSDTYKIYVTDIPILHSIILARYDDDISDEMHVNFYTYNDDMFNDNLKVEFIQGSKYFNRYEYELNYIMNRLKI